MTKNNRVDSIINQIRNINWRMVAIEIGAFVLIFILFLFAAGAFY